MIYGSVAFAVFLLVVVALKYFAPESTACPQCGQAREDDHPLCTGCGWIFETADESEDDDDDVAEEEPWV